MRGRVQLPSPKVFYILVGCKWSRLCILRGDSAANTADGGPLPGPPSVQAAPQPIVLGECRGHGAAHQALQDRCYLFLVKAEKKRGENLAPPSNLGQEEADIQSGGRGEASERHDLIQMFIPLPGAVFQIK